MFYLVGAKIPSTFYIGGKDMKYSLYCVIFPYFYVLQYKIRNINGFKLKSTWVHVELSICGKIWNHSNSGVFSEYKSKPASLAK